MVRPYGVKGQKRKKRKERYDKEEDVDEQSIQEAKRAMTSKAEMGTQSSEEEEEEEEETEKEQEQEEKKESDAQADEIEGIPIVPSDPNVKKPGIIFVLEKASLEVAKVGKTYQILNSDDHANFLRKNNKNPADYRPDIVYQALLSILDSPVNKAGRLRAVYVKTEKGVLFEVKPHVRIPRTYKRFSGIMLQLLQKLSITAVGKREKLLRVIKNPVTQYLPANSRKIVSLIETYNENLICHLNLQVGAMAHGKIDCDYIDDFIAISGYPLSAAWCISKICEAVADKWNVI
ncbi:ribosomal RNA small subunit methyltransferase nep-1 isoform X2 [Jatropha curcas]|uniref:ribosomal RNA small subunit methyltransferase nep-1 isoform X2 n=1 Tax=Jatropha curcas TaxID=180498 RepID=UPI0009D798EB|nr:ribosomal RNA small subunit methyltransferase nep-1 isoform X2 [Jatropha curcas]